ncbi:Krueppel-like factor 12 isoform X5 [Passer domesticus]|uniref:Krueppel-like factor 12 isoform X5 n=1 Tax=Passer domesticus TaxID=48849 RepID=UPI0030FE52D0
MKRKAIKDISAFENRMLMLDGMPAVRVKTELLESEQGSPNVHNYPDMDAVPLLLNNMKADPTEDSLSTDHFQTQTEPVDLSINKARSSPTAASSSPVSMTASASSPSSTSTSSSSSRPASSPTVITSVSSAASVPSVLTPGPLVASASGVGGQQFLHIIHPVPPSSPMNLQSNKMSHVHRIPVVVQSVPVVYTAVRSPGNMNNTIVVPLLEDGRSHVKAQMDPRGLSPRQIKSDSDDDDLPNVTLDSVNETGSTALSIARAVQEESMWGCARSAVNPFRFFNSRLSQMGDVWQLEDPDAKFWNTAFLHWHVGSWLASWLAPLLTSWLLSSWQLWHCLWGCVQVKLLWSWMAFLI